MKFTPTKQTQTGNQTSSPLFCNSDVMLWDVCLCPSIANDESWCDFIVTKEENIKTQGL